MIENHDILSMLRLLIYQIGKLLIMPLDLTVYVMIPTVFDQQTWEKIQKIFYQMENSVEVI